MNFRVLQIFRWFIGLGWDFFLFVCFFSSKVDLGHLFYVFVILSQGKEW